MPSIAHPGQTARTREAIYKPYQLRAYDFIVARVTCPYFWRVPVPRVLNMYERHMSADHLDVGVGTGYWLDHAASKEPDQAITLVDINPHALEHTARRLARYDVTTHRASALAPLPVPRASFGSASFNFVLHCIPGDLSAKGAALGNVAACVKPGGWLFGSTVLRHGVPVGPGARGLSAILNRRGVFHNEDDSLEELEAQLNSRFSKYRLSVQGCTALFEVQVGGPGT